MKTLNQNIQSVTMLDTSTKEANAFEVESPHRI